MSPIFSKKKNKLNRLAPKYARGVSWLMLHSFLIAGLFNSVKAQESVYVVPDVNIFETEQQEFELPGTGDYIPKEEYSAYNFQNINEILRRTPGVYTREEGGFGLFPNISLRGTDTLRSAKTAILQDGINIAPAPYSAPDAYFSPIAAMMSGIEVLKGASQFRFGPNNTGGAINYITSPVDFGQRANLMASYGSFNDKSSQFTGNYGVTGAFGSIGLLGEFYYRENDGFKDFSSGVDSSSYGSDDANGLEQQSPLAKILWQLPTKMPIVIELKGGSTHLDYNGGYQGLTTSDFNTDPYQRYSGSQRDVMNSNQQAYYARLHVDFNSKISNQTTVYYNKFTRDWFKLSSAGGDSLSKLTSKAYQGSNLGVLKGTTAGTVKYVSNNRKYYTYGVMNQSRVKFDHTWKGTDGNKWLNLSHDFKVGVKFHRDSINRDQYNANFTQAVGGGLTGLNSTSNADRNQITRGAVAWFEDTVKINQDWTILFGSRFEAIEQFYRNRNTLRGWESSYAFVPGGGVIYDYDNNWSWFAGVYKGFSFTGPSGAVDDGTPLQPEKSVQKELGFRYNNNSLFTQLTAFHVNYDNLLVIDNSNSGNSADNAGEVVTQGIEFSSVYSSRDLMPKGDISFFFNGTYTDAYLPSNTKSTDAESIFAGGTKGAMMPYIPEYDFALGADYTIDKFTLGLEGSYTPEMFTSALNTESEQNSSGTADARHGKTDDHFLLNINLAYKLSDMFGISAGVKNALDLEYISSRHPGGARSGAPISAWVKAKATY